MRTVGIDDSSNIRAISYDCNTQDMIIMFYTGISYLYKEVPENIVCQLTFADSAGKAFARLIKNGGYSYVKLPNEEE